ncbi:MAG: DUF2147 domain-containing protein [Alphaproteobacteria bacterium]|nr:DUF2147 domain-containing protein [Alphaproteobacteria bacterium]
MPVFPNRRRPSPRLSAFLGTLLCAFAPSYSAGANEIGLWYDDSGRGAVLVAPCGDKICGHIVWLEDNRGSDGKPLHDAYNPEPSLRSRPVCGIQVIGNLSPQGDGTLGDGWIYDPKVGKSYNVEISLAKPDVLHVYGFLGLKLMGRSIYWKRAPDDLPRCDDKSSSQKASQ